MNHLLKKLLVARDMEYLIIDRNFLIFKVSSGVKRFAESPQEVTEGNDVRNSFPELIGIEENLEAILEGQQHSFNLKSLGRYSINSSPLYFDLNILENTDKNNSEKQLIILFEEVTDRMSLEQTLVQATNETNLLLSALSKSKEYIDKIVTSMADALIVTNKVGSIQTVNQSAQSLFGYSEPELINKPLSLLIANKNFSIEVFQEYHLSKGEFLKDVEVICKTKTGEKVSVAFSCSVIQSEAKDLQFIYIARDISDRQRAQQRLIAQYATARILSESATLKQAAPKVLQAICESLGWTVGELWMPQESREVEEHLVESRFIASGAREFQEGALSLLKCVQIWHRPSVNIPNFIKKTKQTTFTPGVGLPGRIWTSRSSQWINDVSNDSNFLREESASKDGLHGSFGFPILGGEEVLGVMTFFSHEIEQPDRNLLQMVDVIGSQMGQFIKRKQAESVRSQLADRIRLLLESTDEGIFGINLQGNCTFINKAASEMLGYQPDELLGRNMHELIHHTHSDGCPYPHEQCPIFKAFRKGLSCRVDTEVLWRRDRTAFAVEYSSRPIVESAVIQGAVVTFVDITERKQAAAALRESEERYRDLFENANDLIQSVAANGHFIYVNRAWRESLGYSEAEVAQMKMLDIIPPDCRTEWMQVFGRVMSGEKVDKVETLFLTKDGRKISLEGSVNCAFVNGKPVATRAIFRDITDRLLAEKALRLQQYQTERLLLNILPEQIATRLKQQPGTIADDFDEVSVMFADIVGFTELSSQRSPAQLIGILNKIFSKFDQLAEQHGLEKIKTIGDAYMVVGGIPMPMPNHAEAIAQMALDMQLAITQFSAEIGQKFSIRIGINTGPVVAGVIGTKKFTYDLWGDTVNIASRMESQGLPGKIQVTAATYEHLRDRFLFENRGAIKIKGKGEMNTYFLSSWEEKHCASKSFKHSFYTPREPI